MASRRSVLDRVHDLVHLPPQVSRAVDTPVFQRLRGLKQVGVASFVYPGAVHTRFEHSIGVAHLARVLYQRIRQAQPDLAELRPEDEVPLMLAGLAHDVGHGPFSHVFEDVIAKNMGVSFDHEAMSQRLTRRMLDGVVDAKVCDDVLTIMNGASTTTGSPPQTVISSPWDGPRGAIADIVSNKRCGVDVDKLDYFLRDSLSCYGRPTVDARYARLFNGARFVQARRNDNSSWLLAFDRKVMNDVRELWTLRSKLHSAVYQHATVKVVGQMIGDALMLAEPHFDVDGRGRRLRDCLDDEDRFLTLGDWILDAVGASSAEDLAPARAVLSALHRRELYPRVLTAAISPHASLTKTDVRDGILAEVRACDPGDGAAAAELEKLLLVDTIHITPAKHAGDDPLARVTFCAPRQAKSSRDRLPLSFDGGVAPPSVFSSTTYRERTALVFLRHSLGEASLSKPLERLARSAAAKWHARQRHAGVLLPETFVLGSDLGCDDE